MVPQLLTVMHDFKLSWLAEVLRWKDKLPRERLTNDAWHATEMHAAPYHVPALVSQVTIRLPQPTMRCLSTRKSGHFTVTVRLWLAAVRKFAAQRAAGTQSVHCYQ